MHASFYVNIACHDIDVIIIIVGFALLNVWFSV